MLQRLRENWLYKLLALGFAFALHFYASNLLNPPQSRTLPVPVTPRNLSPDLLWPKTVPPVTVTLTGPADSLSRIADSNITATVDLSGATPGKPLLLPIHLSPGAADGGVSLEVEPRTVSVTLAVKSAKWMPLTASAPGAPPVGYTFQTPAISPKQAKVIGSREAVDAVQQLIVKVDSGLKAGTINDDFPVVALDKQNNQVPDVVVKPATAHVRIEMARVPATKTLIVSPNVTGALPFPFQITSIDINPQTVTVSGRPEVLSQVSTLPTTPLDVSGATADVSRPVALVLPPGLTLVGASTVTVTVHVASQPTPGSSPATPNIAPAPAAH